ncbi:MAG: type II toxin-antitoxin system RelE/ParE family toxin [Nitrospirota bacterium]
MWQIKHGKIFYRELSMLPKQIRKEIEKIAFGELLKNEPFRKKLLEKIKGQKEHYKIKIGEYRVGLKINKKEKTIEFRRALHRKEIYRYFP